MKTIITTRGRKFLVDIEPIFFTEEIVGFRVTDYQEIDKDHPAQKIMRDIVPQEPSLFPYDEINPLLELRT
jgi:hypothetical protein